VLVPIRVAASFDLGLPTYDDITYIKVTQFSLVASHWYTYESYYQTSTDGLRVSVSLESRDAPLPKGQYVAVHPTDAFRSVADILKASQFFDMHLALTKTPYIDGPEDEITVERCGVTTTLGTISRTERLDFNAPPAKQFFALEARLRDTSFAQTWKALLER
jgi:hypothetical protein